MDNILHARRATSFLSKLALSFSCALVMLFLPGSQLLAQTPSCGCNGRVNLTLDDNCQFEVTVATVQAGDCGDDVRIIIDDSDPSNGNIVDCAGIHNYGIFDDNNNLVCWGEINAEDKTGPALTSNIQPVFLIECNYIDQILNNPATIDPDNDLYIGQLIFEDNCGSTDCGCSINRTFYDELDFVSCQESASIFATMTRRWTATDCEGNQTIEEQFYNFYRPSLSVFRDLDDQTVQTCDPASVTDVDDFFPYMISVAFSDTIRLDEIDCDYSVSVNENRFQVCDDGSFKLEREIRVLDWCSGFSSVVDNYVVKVGDFEAPEVEGSNATTVTGNALTFLTNNFDRSDFEDLDEDGHLPMISVGNNRNCTASFFLDQNSIEAQFGVDISDCSAVDINASIYNFGQEVIFGFPQGPEEWRATNYPTINNIASGVPEGLFALVLELDDNCKNNTTIAILFKVKDLIPPIMSCDDQLNISVSTAGVFNPVVGAYARVDAIDVDEGSDDNCELDRLLVRRSVEDLAACQDAFIALGYDANNDGVIDGDDWFDENNNGVFDEDEEFQWEFEDGVWMTPWREFAEFFCCDVDQTVRIELLGIDGATDPLSGMSMPNTNVCWLDVLIEDGSDPVISSLPTQTINCDDEALTFLIEGTYSDDNGGSDILDQIRARFGTAFVQGTDCGNVDVEETITYFFNANCPIGYIEREISVVNTTDGKGTSSTSTTQRINVDAVHDYWICFPEDVERGCADADVDIPGITTSEGSCDLFAVDIDDERFDTNPNDPDNGCFKIFRTYSIINWCEYDGESQPVIVGRDWDEDNGINPTDPDGDDAPGDEGICVIVKRDFNDDAPDTTYYDRDTDPYNQIPGFDEDRGPDTLSFWWRVISGSNDVDDPDYFDGPFDNDQDGTIESGEFTTWRNDPNDNGSLDDDDLNFGSIGFWRYTQHIKISDSTPPIISADGDDTFCSISNVDCAGDVTYTIDATDNCSPTGDLNITVFLDVGNDGGTLIDVTSDLIGTTFSARYPIGTHRLIFRIDDICGSNNAVEKIFTVEDCLAPAPICTNVLIVNLQPDQDDTKIGSIEIWASDFTNNSPIGDCTGQGPETVNVNGVDLPRVTKFSINRIGEPYDPEADGLEVTCADVGQLVPVEVHAIDEAGNNAFCEVFIDVQDQNNLCPGGSATAQIAGSIKTESGNPVSQAEVNLSGHSTMMYMSDENGQFGFPDLEVDYDYSIQPTKDNDYRNGVNIVDLIAIKKHVLGVEKISSPYRQIAADANKSGSITVKDLIEVQRLILHKTDAFEGNSSWRFVDVRYSFNNPEEANAEAFSESVNINNLRRSQMFTDFVGVKIGDTNESAQTSGAQPVDVRSGNEPLVLNIAESIIPAGTEQTVYVKAGLKDYQGLQFTMELAPQLELLDVESALLSDEEMAVFQKEGTVTAAWFTTDNVLNEEETTLFALKVRAKAEVAISEAITVSSRRTDAVAVSTDKQHPIQLNFGATTLASVDGFMLFSNQPNPFTDMTMVNFQLPKASRVTVTINDVNGRVVKSFQQNFEAGQNQIQLTSKDFPVPGVYYFTLSAGEFTATDRLINVE
ncbi:MAG: T9SS type A sorting domain-containing protein [Bacteroidota bacterium]